MLLLLTTVLFPLLFVVLGALVEPFSGINEQLFDLGQRRLHFRHAIEFAFGQDARFV